MKKKEIVDDVTMKRAITRITYEMIERNKNLDQIVLAGIKTRGVYIARRIQERLKQLENLDVPLIELDTKAFRDDIKSELDTSVVPVSVDRAEVILVDDVLYTGRTIRAAIDNIVSRGRPARVSLAVLVDRGHRELPIRADYVGKNIPTSESEEIEVLVSEIDGVDSINIIAPNWKSEKCPKPCAKKIKTLRSNCSVIVCPIFALGFIRALYLINWTRAKSCVK